MVKFGYGLLATLALLFSMNGFAAQTDYGKVTPGSEAAHLDHCVAPTRFMRSKHYTLLFHQRDITVREGIRDSKDSLNHCVDCHAAKDPHGNFIPVNAPGQFCESCHEHAGVELKCFSCHAAVPDKTGK